MPRDWPAVVCSGDQERLPAALSHVADCRPRTYARWGAQSVRIVAVDVAPDSEASLHRAGSANARRGLGATTGVRTAPALIAAEQGRRDLGATGAVGPYFYLSHTRAYRDISRDRLHRLHRAGAFARSGPVQRSGSSCTDGRATAWQWSPLKKNTPLAHPCLAWTIDDIESRPPWPTPGWRRLRRTITVVDHLLERNGGAHRAQGAGGGDGASCPGGDARTAGPVHRRFTST